MPDRPTPAERQAWLAAGAGLDAATYARLNAQVSALEATVRDLAALGLAAVGRYAAAQGALAAFHPLGADEGAEAARWIAAALTAIQSYTYDVLGVVLDAPP